MPESSWYTALGEVDAKAARLCFRLLSADLNRRIAGSRLINYPNSGHGGIFQYHNEFGAAAVDFLD
jgi:hypothetical protein